MKGLQSCSPKEAIQTEEQVTPGIHVSRALRWTTIESQGEKQKKKKKASSSVDLTKKFINCKQVQLQKKHVEEQLPAKKKQKKTSSLLHWKFPKMNSKIKWHSSNLLKIGNMNFYRTLTMSVNFPDPNPYLS